MTDTNRTVTTDREAGFTMIEIIIVMVLATVFSTIAVTGTITAWDGYRWRSTSGTWPPGERGPDAGARRNRAVWRCSIPRRRVRSSKRPRRRQNIGGRGSARNVRFMARRHAALTFDDGPVTCTDL
jgi:prepilin-type N-terminal cleavage/methylation domain-containing protein